METKDQAPQEGYADLTLDLPFKKAFATEEDKDLLIALLNAFLEKKLKQPITDVVIKNPYVKGQAMHNRDSIFDIRCQDTQGNRFIVEVQIGRQVHFIKRTLFYICMAIANNGVKGEWDFDYPPVYTLSFLDFDLDFGKDNEDVVQYLSLSNEEHPEIRYNFINLVFVRLTKFSKSLDECETFRDRLIFALRHAHEFKERPEQLSGSLFERLFSIAKFTNFTPEEQSEYWSNMMNKYDQQAALICAKKEGREEGIAIGDERGEARGMEKKALQTAIKMKVKGLNIALIAEVTGLSEKEIEGLDTCG